jgi:hypothetical protein
MVEMAASVAPSFAAGSLVVIVPGAGSGLSLLVLAQVVMMRRLMMMVCGGMVVCGGLVMMLARRKLGHGVYTHRSRRRNSQSQFGAARDITDRKRADLLAPRLRVRCRKGPLCLP